MKKLHNYITLSFLFIGMGFLLSSARGCNQDDQSLGISATESSLCEIDNYELSHFDLTWLSDELEKGIIDNSTIIRVFKHSGSHKNYMQISYIQYPENAYSVYKFYTCGGVLLEKSTVAFGDSYEFPGTGSVDASKLDEIAYFSSNEILFHVYKNKEGGACNMRINSESNFLNKLENNDLWLKDKIISHRTINGADYSTYNQVASNTFNLYMIAGDKSPTYKKLFFEFMYVDQDNTTLSLFFDCQGDLVSQYSCSDYTCRNDFNDDFGTSFEQYSVYTHELSYY